MKKNKFYLPDEPGNFEETLKGLYQLNYDDTGIEINEKLDDKNRVIGIDYKDTLSSREALKNMRTDEIRMRNGSATITYNDDGTTFIDKKVTGCQARKTFGIKHFSPGFTFNYRWKRGFDENGRRIYASGVIEGEDHYFRDTNGRITLSTLDNGRETNAFEYDEKGRIVNWKYTYLRSGLDGKDTEEKRHFEYGKNGNYTVKSINKRDHAITSRSITECNSRNEILSEIYQDTDLRTYYERHLRPQEDDYMRFLYDTESGKIEDIYVEDDKGSHTLKGNFKFDAAAYLAVPNAVFRSCNSVEMLDKAVEYEQNLENSIVGNLSKVKAKISKTKKDAAQLAESVLPAKTTSRKSSRSATKDKSIEL